MAARAERGSVGAWLVLFGVVFLLVVSIGLPILLAVTEGTDAFGKSYDFPRVQIDATVLDDGSLHLREQRTFDFDGEFSFAFFTVDWPVDQIKDFTISENGGPVPFTTDESNSFQFNARWEFAAEDEERTFTISYRAVCAVDVWADTAHLNWQFIGTGWDVPTRQGLVRVHLPPVATRDVPRLSETCPPPAPGVAYETRPLQQGEVLAWGHGPLGGEVRLPDPSTVTLEIRDLPPSTFVEGSIVFPKESVPLAYEVPAPMRQLIVDEEARLAQEANAQRRALLAEERAEAARRRVFLWVLLAVALVFVVIPIISRLRDRLPGVPKTMQEPPEDIHPVDLAQLWSVANGRMGTQTVYRAQMLYLAQIGAIELQAVGPVSKPKDFRVRLRDVKDANSRDMEFLEFLFPKSTDDDISLRSLKPTGSRRSELNEWTDALSERRRKTLKRILPGPRWESITVTTIGIVGIIASFMVPAFVGPLGLLLLPVSLFGMAIANAMIRPRLAEPFRERVVRWRAFRRFLKEFSTFEEAPALAVTIWEHYLVYATALGVADEVEKQIKALIPVQELPSPWKGAPSGVNALVFVHSVNTVPVHTAASATIGSSSTSSGIGSFSSSSGGGGGFSGGGGGGGGGTGGGAG